MCGRSRVFGDRELEIGTNLARGKRKKKIGRSHEKGRRGSEDYIRTEGEVGCTVRLRLRVNCRKEGQEKEREPRMSFFHIKT